MHPSDAGPRPLTDLDSAWRATAPVAAGTVFFFDFDGTLAPIQDDPHTVVPVPGLVDHLAELGTLVGRIAIVSARPVDFLRERFGQLPRVDLYGLYGLECGLEGGPAVVVPEALAWMPTVAEVTGRAERELPAGALVEFKKLSVSLHYRTAPHLRDEIEAWATRVSAESGLRAQPGRMVVELKPPVDRDKGDVVRGVIGEASGAWYFGDDLSDIKAFRALTAYEKERPGFVAVRVAVANPETGADVAAAADLTLDSPAAVPGVLADGVVILRSGRPD